MIANPVRAAIGRPFRLAMIGGARPSMIGPVHRIAAAMDGRFEVVAAILSSNPERSRAEGQAIGLAAERCYATAQHMIAAEAARPDGIEAAAVTSPNDSHGPYLRAALAAGLDVMVEKPLCNDLADALLLRDLAKARGVAVGIAHAYAGYPMVREMRARIAAGEIGEPRLVQVEYLGSGLAARVEDLPDAHRRWRLDPARSGPSLVLGDIGTHAHHLACFVTGHAFEAVSAEVGTIVPGRRVQDYAQVRFRMAEGVRGALTLCQAAAGASNHIVLRVFGSLGHAEWRHGEHGRLTIASLDGDVTTIGSGQANLSEAARQATRLARAGHPEGLHEAFANLYADLAELMLERRTGRPASPCARLVPSVDDGVDGLKFVTACLASAAKAGAWVGL